MALQNFIVLEGIDGAGTSTQLNILKERTDFINLSKEDVYFTAEPTSTQTGKFIRQVLKGDIHLKPETIAYLFTADRNEHIFAPLSTDGRTLISGIFEACNSNHLVISDRYFFSSLAYQSIECGWELPFKLNKDFPLPQLLFYFEISPEESLKRITGRGITEIYEKVDFLNKSVEQYHKAIELYKQEALNNGMKIIVLDASKNKEEISEIIWNEIKNLPIIQR